MNHSLLHAPQVNYIIRSDVKIIAHRRTLVLYIYDRKRAATGSTAPVWTMFQAGEEYTTLAWQEDGTASWREAAFENLDRDYYFTRKCAFYSAQDEERVCNFFRDRDHGGIAALVRAQRAVLDKRAQERQLKREKRTIARMRTLRALPRGLNAWVRREVMPAYFRCQHSSAKKPVTGVCTSCGKESTLPHAAHNAKVVCPRCKRELTVKSAGKMRQHFDRDTAQVIEKISDNEIVIRIIKIWFRYGRDDLMPKTGVYENARVFVRRGPDGKITVEPYYYSYSKGTLTRWMPGERPVFSRYCYNFEADACGHIYCRNLPEALAGTSWEYCPLAAYYNHFHASMQLLPFLGAYLRHPRLEHLVKVGFYNLASDLVYRGDCNHTLDEVQDRTHRILRVQAEDIHFLRELDVDMDVLEAFQGYAGLKDRQRLLRWQLDNHVSRDVAQVLTHVTPHKLMKYIDAQYATLHLRNGYRYNTMQYTLSEYRDYLDMCARLEYDMSNSFVIFPKDLQEAHDRVQNLVRANADALLRRDFQRAMEAVAGHLDFELDGMKILLPASPKELADEGHALHHCVGRYADRIAQKECIILFLRKCEDIGKPFYTVEIRNRKVVQVRGMGNRDATPDVEKFMDQWERQVLQAA